MRARDHIALGGAAAAGLFPFLGLLNSALFWMGSVLIDIDHYLEFVWRNQFRDLSLRRMFLFHDHLFQELPWPDSLGLNLFHTVECLGAVLLLGLWTDSVLVLVMLAGMGFHLCLDEIQLIRLGIPFQRAFSIIEYWIRWNFLVRRGDDPLRVYREALAKMHPINPGPPDGPEGPKRHEPS